MAGTGGSITEGVNGNYPEGTVINIAATSSDNYSFNKWTSTGGGTFSSAANTFTSFTMPATSVTITANFTYNGGSAGNGGSSS